mmetsp:Transcript_98346/g.262829  ORF Transcript_98346/g.262829 Transcript_98346/m.262829 type:complete len:204 (-) Transcript_98346:81-692(-)
MRLSPLELVHPVAPTRIITEHVRHPVPGDVRPPGPGPVVPAPLGLHLPLVLVGPPAAEEVDPVAPLAVVAQHVRHPVPVHVRPLGVGSGVLTPPLFHLAQILVGLPPLVQVHPVVPVPVVADHVRHPVPGDVRPLGVGPVVAAPPGLHLALILPSLAVLHEPHPVIPATSVAKHVRHAIPVDIRVVGEPILAVVRLDFSQIPL